MNKFCLILPLCIMLGACQTTGMGMGAPMASSTTSIPYGITPADSQMNCTEMQAEFNRMDQIIASGQQNYQQNAMTQAGAQAAQQAASSAGYGQYSGLFGSLSSIGTQMSSSQQQQTRQQAQAAQVRRDQLLNLAYQKGCIR